MQTTRSPLAALWSGLALTVVAAVVPLTELAGTGVLSDHLRDAYPAYDDAEIDTAVDASLFVLLSVAALGAVGWIVAIAATRAGARWVRWYATAAFVTGTAVALTILLMRDTSGEPGFAPVVGWVGMLPSVAGATAVALLWRRTAPEEAVAVR